MSALPQTKPKLVAISTGEDARAALIKQASNELVFGVVGGAGAGTSTIADALEGVLLEIEVQGRRFDVVPLKASAVIRQWAARNHLPLPEKSVKTLAAVGTLQDYGDKMREGVGTGVVDHSAVARALITEICRARAARTRVPFVPGEEVAPDGAPRAYILDSLRHPAEVELLRQVYGDAFILVGVVCETNKREARIKEKYDDAGGKNARLFMSRDTDDSERKHGQHVAEAFHLADFFVDNTHDREISKGEANPDWNAAEDLDRLARIISGQQLERPTMAETAMYHAFSTQMQSACLSRQVGAALVNKAGNIVATGSNEVPKAGGGVYGESAEPEQHDARCAYFGNKSERFCRNTEQQNQIAADLIDTLTQLEIAIPDKDILIDAFRRTRIGGLLEFSRAVHAEMDALLSAARTGVTLLGTRLFVTTFPCHYCARHIVAAGVDEVQYIEPYPKSMALALHEDSITTESRGWQPPSAFAGGQNSRVAKVLFRPFTGVSPRLYRRAFLKDRELKDKRTGMMVIHEPRWTSPWHLPKISYVTVEARLTEDGANA